MFFASASLRVIFFRFIVRSGSHACTSRGGGRHFARSEGEGLGSGLELGNIDFSKFQSHCAWPDFS